MSDGFAFEARFAGLKVDVLSSRISRGRTLITHRYPKKDGADLEDMGREPLVIDLELVFIDNRFSDVGEGDYLDRFASFEALYLDGATATLLHPYVGNVSCKLSRLEESADGSGQPQILASATFTEDLTTPPTLAVEAGVPAQAGAHEVNVAAIEADATLADQGLESTVTGDVADAAETWSVSPDLSTRAVQLEMSGLNNRLDAELATFEAATNIDRYPIVREYTRLQYQLRRAAEAFTATLQRVIEVELVEPLPLRVFAGRFYGAAEADTRFAELLELNPGLATPGLVPRGTRLKAFAS